MKVAVGQRWLMCNDFIAEVIDTSKFTITYKVVCKYPSDPSSYKVGDEVVYYSKEFILEFWEYLIGQDAPMN